MTKNRHVQLPLFTNKELSLLPTQKLHTSYSEMTSWIDCSWRHKLDHIDKVGTFSGNIHTGFGTCVHSAIESYLWAKRKPRFEEVEIMCKEEIKRFSSTNKLDKNYLCDLDAERFIDDVWDITQEFQIWFEETFPKAEVFALEYPFFSKFEPLQSRYFKGFADCILKIPVTPTKKQIKEGKTELFKYLIIDWKGQRLSAPILTPQGWTTMGELKVGDQVCSSDGRASVVTGIFPLGKKEIYRVHFRDGSVVDTTDDHLWKVHTVHNNHKILTTKDLINNHRYRYVPVLSSPVIFEKNHTLPIDPYLLGVLLGDGCMRKGSIRVSTSDQELLDEISKYLPKGQKIRHVAKYDYGLTGGAGSRQNPLLTSLRQLGLADKRSFEKFIPGEYLFSSPEERLSLIQGLLDTDGWVQKGIPKFSSTSIDLANGMKHLVGSVGGVAFISKRKKKRSSSEKTEFIVTVRLPKGMNPFRLSRKLSSWNPTPCHKLWRKISKIELLPEKDEMQCISVSSPDHLYITNDFILTHNTTARGWFAEKRRDPVVRMQLALYKHFFSQEFGVPLSDIKLAFVLIKRNVKEDKSDRFEVLDISAAEVTIQKALDTLRKHIVSVEKGLFLKNRNSCKWCDYKNTTHCR